MRLSELKTGESATIVKVMGHGGFRRRIMEMGFVRGQRVEVILNAPLKDPIEYKIMGYDISLRRSEADMVVVLTDDEAGEYLARRERHRHQHHAHSGECGCPAAETAPAEIRTEEFGATESDEACCASIDEVVARHSRTIAVALVGNPNSGKTSLFNAISGGHEHVGNYSGVTVGAKIGHRTYRGYRFEVTDLPGTYALSAYTPEERYVRHHLATKTPDVVINSVVASNLERNLYLTTELIDINPRMVVALNMFDELQDSGAKLDYDSLGRMLGVPMVPVEARNNRGIEALLDTVIDVFENRDERVRHIHINMGPVIDEGLRKLNGDMSAFRDELPKNFPPRYYAMKMLEGDRQAEESLRGCERYGVWAEIRDREARRIAGELGEDVETAFANQKYGFIQGALKETFTPGRREEVTTTAMIDTFVTHKLWGFPIFFALMWLMFWCTFSLGAYPQEWIDALVGWIGSAADALLPAGPLRDLLVDGVIGGVGAVIVFLPNIMILYLFISFMEDSGYLARAAFIMDRVMHRIGVHGKSFIPLIMGFGCNVPAIMACRTIESRSSRLITILITPFMSCSARIPIYLLLAGTFFAADAGTVMLGLYALGIVLAVVTARLMRRFLFPVDETPFVMELPPYRLPTWKTTLSHMWDAVPQEDGRHDPDRFGHRVVFELLPPHGRRRRNRGALRKFLPRTARQGLRAGVQPPGIQLESRRVPAVGPPGQRDRGVDARRALLRRRRDRSRRGGGRDRRCGRRDGNHRENGRSDAGKGIPDRGRGGGGLALAAAARERRLHDGLGAGVPRLHPALHALHRHGGRHRRRSRVEMGCGVGGLQHDAGLVRGVDCIPDRTDILNDELAGLHRRGHRAGGCGHRREAAVVFRARTAAGRMRVVRVGAMPAQEAHRQELICRTRAAPGRFSK